MKRRTANKILRGIVIFCMLLSIGLLVLLCGQPSSCRSSGCIVQIAVFLIIVIWLGFKVWKHGKT